MSDTFNADKAKKHLLEKEEKEKTRLEEKRKALLEKVIAILRNEFKGSSVEVYLVGSILQPFRFTARSDVDIVLKNYRQDRFEFWAKIEREIGRKVEIILFETCSFQEFVLKEGLKVT